jgi:hypothetical protein
LGVSHDVLKLKEGCGYFFIPYIDVLLQYLCPWFAYGAIAFEKSLIASCETKKSP